MISFFLQTFALVLVALALLFGTWHFVIRAILRWSADIQSNREQLKEEPSKSGRKFRIKRKALSSRIWRTVLLSLLLTLLWGAWGYFAFGAAKEAYGLWIRPIYYERAAAATEKQAAEFLEQGKVASAIRVLTESARRMPTNADLFRAFAKVLRQIGDPGAIELQERVIALSRAESPADELLLLEYRIAFRNLDRAAAQYESFPAEMKESVEGLRLMAALCLTQDLRTKAREYHDKARALAPNDPVVREEHALWSLTDLEAGERTRRLSDWEDETRRLPMESVPLQILITHLMQTDVLGVDAEPFARAIERSTQPWEAGRFLYLIWLDRYRPEASEREIDLMIEDPLVRRRSFGRLMPWLVGNGYLEPAYRLATVEDAELDHYVEANLWEARFRVQRKEVDALRECLTEPGWATMRCLRAAYAEWAYRQKISERGEGEAQGKGAKESGASWQSALAWAREETHLTEILYETVKQWGWESESEEVLLIMASSNHPRQRQAAAQLQGLHLERGDRERYLQAVNAALRRDPENVQLRNDSIYLSSLIFPTDELFERAEKLFSEHKEDLSVRGTYAFLLAKGGYREEALDLLKSVPESRLRNSAEALAYALALEVEDPEKALVFAKSAIPHLIFPRERELCMRLIQRLEDEVK